MENDQKTQTFTSFTQYFDNNRRDDNQQDQENRHQKMMMTPFNNENNSNSLLDVYGNKQKHGNRNIMFGESSLLGLQDTLHQKDQISIPGLPEIPRANPNTIETFQNRSPIFNNNFLDNPEINP